MMNSLMKMVLYFISTVLVQIVQGDLTCKYKICMSDDFHCCNGYCCEDSDSIYNEWWFWLIICFVIGCISCCIKGCCRYNRNRNSDYQRIARVQTPNTYNSVTQRPPLCQGSEVIAPVKYTTVAPKLPPYSEVGTPVKYATTTPTAQPPAYYPPSAGNTQT